MLDKIITGVLLVVLLFFMARDVFRSEVDTMTIFNTVTFWGSLISYQIREIRNDR